MRLAAVIYQSARHAGASDARFAVREARRLWGDDALVLVGTSWQEALELLPADLDGHILVLGGPMLTLEHRCVPRLVAALAQGADVALACDSRDHRPMAAPDYFTVRGMERYIDRQPTATVAVPGTEQGQVELSTRDGLIRRRLGQASVVRVAGAWAHDSSDYFGADRAEVLEHVPANALSLLDVGGGEGAFLAAAKRHRPNLKTVLVELTADAAAVAGSRGLIDEVVVTDFMTWATADRFDCVSMLDVLEHLPDPEAALSRARGLLSPNGALLLSIPNVGHASVVADLIEGRWDWAPAGIHCFTHLRFFTRRTIMDLLDRVGLVASNWWPVRAPCEARLLDKLRESDLAVDTDQLEIYSYVVLARAR